MHIPPLSTVLFSCIWKKENSDFKFLLMTSFLGNTSTNSHESCEKLEHQLHSLFWLEKAVMLLQHRIFNHCSTPASLMEFHSFHTYPPPFGINGYITYTRTIIHVPLINTSFLIKTKATKIAYQVKTLDVQPDDLSFIIAYGGRRVKSHESCLCPLHIWLYTYKINIHIFLNLVVAELKTEHKLLIIQRSLHMHFII